MAILSVARLGNPILRQVAQPVTPEEIGSPEFQQFCTDLFDSMLEHDGIGLAAPQVRRSQRVVVFQLDEEQGPFFLINPQIFPIGEERVWAYEGCLSVPNMRARVERWQSIRVAALDRDGKPYAFEAHGWSARVVQHECDHLDGIVYVDRAQPGSLCFLDEYRRHGPPIGAASDDDEDDEGDEDESEE